MAIEHADPNARRRAVATVLLALIAGIFAYVAASRWMAGVLALEAHEARSALAHALRWTTVALSVLVVAFGAYLFDFGRKIVGSGRFPPPGAVVLKDTEVLEGRRARNRGALLQTVAVLLVLTALALPVVAFRVTARLG